LTFVLNTQCRVVDRDVQATEALHGEFDECLHVPLAREVGLLEDRASFAQLPHEAGGGPLVPASKNKACAALRELKGRGSPDTTRRSSNDDNSAH
jgi:hypothetical protein